jgi:hypothetical protein
MDVARKIATPTGTPTPVTHRTYAQKFDTPDARNANTLAVRAGVLADGWTADDWVGCWPPITSATRTAGIAATPLAAGAVDREVNDSDAPATSVDVAWTAGAWFGCCRPVITLAEVAAVLDVGSCVAALAADPKVSEPTAVPPATSNTLMNLDTIELLYVWSGPDGHR